MAEGGLAGLPRLVRTGDEARWRGGVALATAVAVAGYWATAWLLEQPVEPVRAGASALLVLVPTLALAVPAGRRRVVASCVQARPVPRACVYETRAAARERRSKLLAVVLTGIVALMVFDQVTGGGGVMAGLLAGVLVGIGVADLVESRTWRRAERSRETRIFALIRHDAMTIGFGPLTVFEDEPPLTRDPIEDEPSPFDLTL